MRTLATMLVVALAVTSAKQAQAIELLVKVGDTIYATQVALGTTVLRQSGQNPVFGNQRL